MQCVLQLLMQDLWPFSFEEAIEMLEDTRKDSVAPRAGFDDPL